MKLVPSAEQAGYAATLHDLLTAADVGAAAARWAEGDTAPGRALWSALADAGATGLIVPPRWGGAGAEPADLVVACEELGHHAVPGPVAESIAAVPALLAALSDDGRLDDGRPPLDGDELDSARPHSDGGGLDGAQAADKWLPELAAGRILATLAAPPWLPYAADAHAAGLVLLAEPAAVRLGRTGATHASMDATRRLAEVSPAGTLAAGPAAGAAVARALDLGALACAAQLHGAGRALLEAAVAYAKTRTQFGRPIGSFQALQHRLADVAVGLEFARPLLYAAAIALSDGDGARDVSAAKVACGEAAHRAARAALQVHGAIGYTREHGLDRWLTKVRVLTLAWGTPAQHRARVMAELTR